MSILSWLRQRFSNVARAESRSGSSKGSAFPDRSEERARLTTPLQVFDNVAGHESTSGEPGTVASPAAMVQSGQRGPQTKLLQGLDDVLAPKSRASNRAVGHRPRL